MNTLYYGDNLPVLREHVKSESVDLVYLDPPFNSNATYNVLFGQKFGARAASQVKAFEDTWTWDEVAARACQEIIERGGQLSHTVQAFQRLLGGSNMMAYLAMMAPRLVELCRVLKPNGSIYLHCDPTASHYLRILMDAVFGVQNYRNEIIWKRTNAKGLAFTRFAANHDTVLRYSKSDNWIWNPPYTAHDPEYVRKFYRFVDQTGRRYRLDNLANPNKDRPNLTYEFLGVARVWRWTKERMEQALSDGLIVQSNPGGVPALKRYLDEQEGTPVGDVWSDIPPIGAQAAERLGYPTQKPVALLERIIQASSNPGDVVLDPFCGCGTTIDASQKLGRAWIGIDITQAAIVVIKQRLKDTYGDAVQYEVIGEPASLPDAAALAESQPYQFQWWVLGKVGAHALEQKKGSDRGIDGRLFFHDEAVGGKTKQVIFQVKAGHTSSNHIRDLHGVVNREMAELGVLITMQDPTQPMRQEAASGGYYKSPWDGKSYPKLQIVTVADLLEGKGVAMPAVAQVNVTYARAPRDKGPDAQTSQLSLT